MPAVRIATASGCPKATIAFQGYVKEPHRDIRYSRRVREGRYLESKKGSGWARERERKGERERGVDSDVGDIVITASLSTIHQALNGQDVGSESKRDDGGAKWAREIAGAAYRGRESAVDTMYVSARRRESEREGRKRREGRRMAAAQDRQEDGKQGVGTVVSSEPNFTLLAPIMHLFASRTKLPRLPKARRLSSHRQRTGVFVYLCPLSLLLTDSGRVLPGEG